MIIKGNIKQIYCLVFPIFFINENWGGDGDSYTAIDRYSYKSK